MRLANHTVCFPQVGSSTTCATTVKPLAVRRASYSSASKTGVVQRLAVVHTHRYPVAVSASEHERSSGARVLPKDAEHAALIVMGKMEEAIPGH